MSASSARRQSAFHFSSDQKLIVSRMLLRMYLGLPRVICLTKSIVILSSVVIINYICMGVGKVVK